ncbi:MAG: hypothetical protein ACOH17_04125 [Cellulomonas sp.]
MSSTVSNAQALNPGTLSQPEATYQAIAAAQARRRITEMKNRPRLNM